MNPKRKYLPTITDPYLIRRKANLSRDDFWGLLGCRSSGPHYEAGRPLPRPVEILIGIVYLGKDPPKPRDIHAEEREVANKPVFKRGKYYRKKPRPHCYQRPKRRKAV